MDKNMLIKYLSYVETKLERKPIYKIEFLNKIDDSVDEYWEDYVGNNSGSINVSNTDGSRRSSSFTIRNYDNKFSSLVSGLSIGDKYKVYLGYELDENEEIYFPQGVFVFSDPVLVSETSNKTINISGGDKWSMLDGTVGGILDATYQVPKGTSLGEFISRTLQLDIVRDWVKPNIDNSIFDAKTTYDIIHQAGETIADVVLEVAFNLSCYVYYDENGIFTMRPFLYDLERPSIYTFDYNGVNYLNAQKTINLGQVYNAVLLVAENMQNENVPIIGYIENNDASDENSILNGTIKKVYNVTEYINGIDSQKKADERVSYELKKVVSQQSVVSLNSLALYHFVENNIVIISDEYLNCYKERFLITSIDFNIGSEATMTLGLVKASKFL